MLNFVIYIINVYKCRSPHDKMHKKFQSSRPAGIKFVNVIF